MGRLLDLLNAAAGEEPLHSAIGRWRQAVSEGFDLVGSTAAGGVTNIAEFVTVVQNFITQQTIVNQTVSADLTALTTQVNTNTAEIVNLQNNIAALATLRQFVQVTRGAIAQVGLNTGTDLILDRVLDSFQSGISYNSATGVFTLAQGQTYLLVASGFLANFSATTADFSIGWFDVLNTELPNDVPAVIVPATFTTSNKSNNPIATAVITPPAANIMVKLRVINSVGGATADLPAGGFVATVRPIR